MIREFYCSDTNDLFNRIRVKRWIAVEDVARRKLNMLDAATNLGDLVTPGNQLKLLKGDRRGQHSIRINDKWRVCFVWKSDNNSYHVEITDYH